MPSPPFVDLPEGVRRVHVETSRGTFAALAASPAPGPDRTVLLVPGFTGSKENFVGIVGPLADAGYRVLAIDLRGQYETAGTDDPSAYTIAHLGADVTAILEVLEAGPVHLVGHSLGGLVARETAIACPDALASLVLLSSGPAALGGPQGERARQLMEALRTMSAEDVWKAMEAVNAEDPAMADRSAEIIEFQRQRFLGSAPAGMIAMAQALLAEPDRVDDLLAAVGWPILVAYGESDAHWSPNEQAKMAGRLGARQVALAGVGHNPASEAPRETARMLVDFWAEVDGAA